MEYKDAVNAAFFNGLITGYTDNTFKPYNTLTRAEACAVILRIIDKSERVYPSMTIYQKRLSETKSFMNMHFNNFVFNETTGTGFVYNTSIMKLPTPSTLAKGGNYEYDFTIDVMTESLKDQNGYDYMIRYDVNMGSEAKAVLNDYLKLLMPYDYTKVIEIGNQNFAAGPRSTKTVELGDWTLQYSNSLTGDSKVTVKIYQR
jgi:S-layer homology domain.